MRPSSFLRRLLHPLAAVVVLLLLAVSTAAPDARATICAQDTRPGATLLLPYFEVDLDGPARLTTLFAIGNNRSSPTLANVVLWTDVGIPTVSFEVALDANEVQTINLRDVLNGNFPDLGNGRNLFTACATNPAPPFDAQTVAHVQAAHTGRPSAALQNLCAGAEFPDHHARGYVTVDAVSRCTTVLPTHFSYFIVQGTQPRVAAQDNVLWGDAYFVDPTGNFAQGLELAQIEADANDDRINGAGDRTFYRNLVSLAGSDFREPLASSYAVRFLIGGPFDGGSQLLCWREGTTPAPFACGGTPPLAPAIAAASACNESGSCVDLGDLKGQLCPLRSSRTDLAGLLPFAFGWLSLNLNRPGSIPGTSIPNQAFVAMTASAEGRYSVGVRASERNSLCP